jgi:nicotinamidase-related amidase
MADVTARHPGLLGRDDTGLVLVDVQEGFRPVIDQFDSVVANCRILVTGFGILGAPVLVTEQYPKGLGHTVPEIAEAFGEGTSIAEKLRFSACGVEVFEDALAATGRRRWVVCGIETHVCVNQTVHDLISRGHEVHVAGDAVSSRNPENRRLGLEKVAAAGARVTSAEMALFEMLEQAGGPEFKQISALVR